jgi:prolyl-tRNA synthetase
MRQAYAAIFNRIGLKTVVVEADNGYIGGEYCHEFVVESESGESKFFQTEDGAYAAHEEVVRFARNINCDEAEVPMEIVKGVGVIGVEKVAAHLGIPVAKTTKTLFYEDEKSNLIGAVVSGEYAVNETKLKHAAGAVMLSLAKEEAIKKRTGATVGYAGLVNLPGTIRVFVDISLKGRKNFETGANRTGYHAKNVNFGRDVSHPDRFYDIAVPNDSSRGPNGQELIQKRGIEVGNIFQLGYHYSKLMKDAVFTDAQGLKKPLYMGCYGIGLERTLATVVEVHHDGKGIIWPESIAPFQVHLISLTNDARADQVYESLNAAGIEVLFDDRDISAGEKFADCDLIGIPIRLVISKKTGEKVEWKRRNETESTHIGLGDVITRLKT